ncbi:hypothetical protein JQ582_39340 [Bradyrhizobium japonicum]|uniref:hypothetical protein n=1 Tax=Bradyrhizobium japonicum TaxID=375 RepID=UPI001BA4A78C|nr:hypothetical protein [Bradyrhizobium japonicum]MBR0749982.1 hypothetical protein [Bradyrhizobium japonicum]
MSNEAVKTRRKLFSSPAFRQEVAERLDLDTSQVTPQIDALLQAGTIPCPHANNAEALGTDGARILLAIGSQQARPASVVRVSERLGAMTMQIEFGNQTSAGPADIFPGSPSVSFEADLAEMIQKLWKAAYGPSRDGFRAIEASVLWSDERGSLLFGKLEQFEKGRPRRTRIYASEKLGLPVLPGGAWDFVHLPTVGGTVFAPLPLLGFFQLLDKGVEGTAASLR